MASITWGPEIAEVYDKTYAAQFEPAVVGPMADLLTGLAGGGPVLEFAVGTGRVALVLSARGITVHGIELSPHMAGQFLAKPGAGTVAVTIGDMTTTRVPGAFTLVYLVANTIMNVTTQDDQLAVFANAAAHLEPGGLGPGTVHRWQPQPGRRVREAVIVCGRGSAVDGIALREMEPARPGAVAWLGQRAEAELWREAR
jgi:SAM-dependent methyltransferase